MAKRYINTDMFSDSWFCGLTPNAKLMFVYLMTRCDHAGLIDFNPRLAEFETGIDGLQRNYMSIFDELGDRLVAARKGYFYLTTFVKFQHPKGLNPNVYSHKAVIDLHESFLIPNESLSSLEVKP